MISLIVCSRTTDVSNELKENVAKTIGVEYEWVVIDNSANQYSIFEAYNEGVSRSKGDILCFMHDDILYHTSGWGDIIIQHFFDEKVGLIGVTGTHFLPKAPAYWFNSPFVSEYNLTNDNGSILENKKIDFWEDKNIVEAVAVDGLCFFIRKTIFSKVLFDEQLYNGFHFYDMDICMQIIKNGYKVCIIRDILIEHFWSENSMKSGMEEFYQNQQIFFHKWEDELPISIGIDSIPNYVINKVNDLCIQANDVRKVRNSKAYKLGKLLLTPLKLLKK